MNSSSIRRCALGLTIIATAMTTAMLATLTGVSGQQGVNLTVFAAASLTDAFTEIGRAFDNKTGGKTTFQFAGSQALRTQLENGAKADVYASANATQFDPLLKTGLVSSGNVFARNRLVVIVPKKGAGNVKTLADLGKPGVKLVLADKTVPVGQYARAVFDAISKAGVYGEDYTARVLKNIVSEEPNVRQVALKVQLGEADAGVVYTTDVTANLAPSVIQIAIPARFNQIASYPIGTLKDSTNPDTAKAFVEFVLSSDGRAILGKWGFLSPR
jgi:molybdate transport system substrate-binding protein